MPNHSLSGASESNSPHPLPINNEKRLTALREYDTISDQSQRVLNDITRLAAQLCEAPIAQVTMVDRDQQRFISHIGSQRETAALEDGFCPMVALQGQTLVVSNAPEDPLFAENAMVVERGIRFYAGAPLVTKGRYVIGAICVMDFESRVLSSSQLENLEALARQAMGQLELSAAQRKIEQANDTLKAVSKGMAAQVGHQFFPALVQHISEALGVDYAYIALRCDQAPNKMKTLSVCYQGQPADNFEYDLDKAPCSDVLTANAFRYYERDLLSLYPKEPSIQALGIEGYAAMPIFDVSGRPLGVLATMNTQPLENPEAIQALLTIFSVRIAAELERQKDEAAQQDLLAREQTAREQAEQANKMKDDFLAVVSHELRSPLNPIIGWAKLLRRGKLNAAKTEAALETIERNAQLQVHLVDDLLDISRILRGKLSLSKIPIKLGTVITNALDMIQLEAASKKIDLQRIDASDEASNTVIYGDAIRLQQIFINLLSNAVKFTPSGGKVIVRITVDEHFATVQITDTGRGISAGFLPDVFKRFRQEDYSTTRQFGGLGLGLAIVQQLVDMHKGKVTASSQGEGQGSTFTVQLPLESAANRH